MATKIKVKKITDLVNVTAADAASDDMILVAHGTNHNEQNQVIYHTNSMTIDALLSYMRTNLANDFMSKEDGNALSDTVDKRLKDAEETMAKSDTADTFFSKLYADDSGKCSLNTNDVQIKGSVSAVYTPEYIFNCDSKAYCHFISQAITSFNVSNPYSNLDANAILQVNTENGWKTICMEPMQKPDLAFDIDLHGYFYGGTKIRAGIQVEGADGYTKIIQKISNKSCLYISRTSDKDPFPVSSFTWWTSNQQTLSSSMADQPSQITADGFVSFSGKYYSGERKPTNLKLFGGKSGGQNVISAPYVMDTVYGIAERSVNGTRVSHRLGSTEHNEMRLKNMAQSDDFSGKYYYISASPADPVSVYMTTDYKFDDSKRYSFIGGNVNPTQIKYTEFNEISSVVGKDNALKVPELTGLIDRFDTISDPDHKGYHRFAYAGGIPMYSPLAKVLATTSLPYIGTDQRNTAYLDVNMPAGSEGCYMRERQQLSDDQVKDTYSLMLYVPEGRTSKTIIRDDTPGRELLNTETSLSIDVLDGSVSEVGVGRNPYNINYVQRDSKTDTYDKIMQFLSYEISNGWTLTAVEFKDADYGNIAVKDFAFAACPRLSAVEFKKNMSMYGRYTFAAPKDKIKFAEFSSSEVKVNNGVADNQSMLSSVKFNEIANGGTHIEDGVLYGTFANCVHLQSVNLSCTDATALSDNVFINCKRLTEVTFPSACVALGQNAFNGCSSLSDITFDSSLTSFSATKSAFSDASNQLTAKNSYNATRYDSGYQFSLIRRDGRREYYIAIQLTGASGDYYQADDSADTNKIFSEISACVTILQKNGLGCTTESKYDARTEKWSPGAGRRYYIKASDGTNIRSTSTSNSELIYNTIGTADKAGVESVKKLMAVDDYVSTSERCNPEC